MLWGPVANGELSGAPLVIFVVPFAHCSASEKCSSESLARCGPYATAQKVPVRVALGLIWLWGVEYKCGCELSWWGLAALVARKYVLATGDFLIFSFSILLYFNI